MEPVRINAHLQPISCAIHGTVSGARIAPIFEPELKMPVAYALSLFGNHSATVLIAAGKFPPSLPPKAARATKKPTVLLTKAWAIADKLQAISERAYPILVPRRSISLPTPNNPTA